MTLVPCACTEEMCGHPAGERCGKEVKVKLKTQISIGPAEFTPIRETGLCEECWATIRDKYAWLFQKIQSSPLPKPRHVCHRDFRIPDLTHCPDNCGSS